MKLALVGRSSTHLCEASYREERWQHRTMNGLESLESLNTSFNGVKETATVDHNDSKETRKPHTHTNTHTVGLATEGSRLLAVERSDDEVGEAKEIFLRRRSSLSTEWYFVQYSSGDFLRPPIGPKRGFSDF